MKKRSRRAVRFGGPYVLPGALLMALVIAAGWLYRIPLGKIFHEQPASLPTVFTALLVLCATLAGVIWGESEALRRLWLRRTQRAAEINELSPRGLFRRLLQRLPDPLERGLAPVLRTTTGQVLSADWQDAGLGKKPSRYLLLLGLTAVVGGLIGDRAAGPVVGLALAIALPLFPKSFVASLAAGRRRRFGEQLPMALDSLAAGLSAGLSFQQAVEFSRQELPDPAAGVLAKLWRRMLLGFPAEEALRSLLQEHPEESLALVIEGIVLQRQFGGDLVRMLEELAALLRERVELEREVRAITTQGRLSGLIVAGLVPVSAGLLLMFNPRYVDVLFNTLPGQVLLVVAMVLLFAGWWVISRLVRVRY